MGTSHRRAACKRFSTEQIISRSLGLTRTWPLANVRRPIPFPAPSDDQWDARYEELYGEGNLAERRELLQITLQRLSRRAVRLRVVLAILRRVKLAEFRSRLDGHRMDRTRPYAEKIAQLVRQSDEIADQILEMHRLLNPYNLPVEADRARAEAERVRQVIRGSSLVQRFPARADHYRRPSAGRQPRPWVYRARHQLARQGVSRDECDNLLEAIGIIPCSGQSRNFSLPEN
jgi:hypothetical protein